DVRRDWHSGSLPALGAEKHLAGAPVDIVEHQRCDLVGPEAELSQHHEDGVVPSPHGGRSVATDEDLLNLRGREIAWQARELPSPDRRNAAGKRELVQTLVMQISEECAQ